jgi:hypothetical protein
MTETSTKYLHRCRTALATEQAASFAATDGWSHVDRPQVHGDWDMLLRALAAMPADAEATSPEVQAMVAQHYAIASRFYVPSREAYVGMSLFYTEDQDMRTFHNAYRRDLAAFLAEAMRVFAQRSL